MHSIFSVTALKCMWRNDESYCHVGAGYRYNWTVTDSVTIQKPYDTQLPTCSCYIVSADKSDHERPCSVEGNTDDSVWTRSKDFVNSSCHFYMSCIVDDCLSFAWLIRGLKVTGFVYCTISIYYYAFVWKFSESVIVKVVVGGKN